MNCYSKFRVFYSHQLNQLKKSLQNIFVRKTTKLANPQETLYKGGDKLKVDL